MKKILIFSILIILNIQLNSTVNVIFKNDIKDKDVTLLSITADHKIFTELEPKESKTFNIDQIPNEITISSPRYAITAIVGENEETYDLGRIELDKIKAEQSNKDIYVTFKSGFFFGYKYSISYKYKPQIIISGPRLVTKSPKEILAQKLNISVNEWNNPSLELALKVFGIDKDYLTIGTLDETTKKMINTISKAKETVIAEKRKFANQPQYQTLFENKIQELNETLAFIAKAHKVLLGPIPLLTSNDKERDNAEMLQLIVNVLSANNE